MNLGIVIQARMGSSRYPGKVLRAFCGPRSLLEIVIARMQGVSADLPVYVATTEAAGDDPLAALCERLGVGCYRGDETDVLRRFRDAARLFGLDGVVRVCADNPFLDVGLTDDLLGDPRLPQLDYLGYRVGGVPAIRTHFGVFTEYVSTDGLERATDLTEGDPRREHVTQCIYESPDRFEVAFRDLDRDWAERADVRLTIDTPADFETVRALYAGCAAGADPTIERALAVLDGRPDLAQAMHAQIEANTK